MTKRGKKAKNKGVIFATPFAVQDQATYDETVEQQQQARKLIF
jgi:hypothetical protein